MISQAMIDAIQEAAGGAGDRTIVNRVEDPEVEPLQASWSRAQFSRVQQFLDEGYWSKAIYEVSFNTGAVLADPYRLANGSRVENRDTGDTGIVRGLDRGTVSRKTAFVTAFVELGIRE